MFTLPFSRQNQSVCHHQVASQNRDSDSLFDQPVVASYIYQYTSTLVAFDEYSLKFATSSIPFRPQYSLDTCRAIDFETTDLKLENRHLYFMKFQISITRFHLFKKSFLCFIRLLKRSLRFISVYEQLLVVHRLIDKASISASFFCRNVVRQNTFRGFHIYFVATLFTVCL